MKQKKQTFSQFLAESANRFMPEEDIELDDTVEIEDEGGELEDELDGEELEGEEETPMMSVEDAIRALQLIINGEAETAEDALDMVQDADGDYDGSEEGEEDELESGEEDELESGEEEVEECNASPVDEEEDVEVEDEVVEEEVSEEDDEVVEEEVEDEQQYGESHNMFLKLSQRYL